MVSKPLTYRVNPGIPAEEGENEGETSGEDRTRAQTLNAFGCCLLVVTVCET